MALVFVTGGVRSGKSTLAQRLAESRAARGARVAVAVFGSDANDDEMADRIARHRSVRPQSWLTVEAADSRSWREQIPEDAVLVLDCAGTLAARAIDEIVGSAAVDPDARALETALDEVLDDTVSWLMRRHGDTVVVSNETGWGIVPVHASGRVFRDSLGRANATLARVADAAYLVVNGRVVDLAALPADVAWPED